MSGSDVSGKDTDTGPVAAIDLRRRFLLELGADLLSGGLPVPDIEQMLRTIGSVLGADDVMVAATPTGLFVTMGHDASTGFHPVGPGLRFEQTAAVLDVMHAVRRRTVPYPAALERLQTIRHRPARWPAWLSDLGALPIGVGLCLLLQPALANVLVAAVASLMVAGVTAAARRWPSVRPLVPVAAAFSVSIVVLLATRASLMDGPLRTIVAVLAVLLPGSLLVTGLSEIAAGALQAGTARLTAGVAQLVLFLAGVLAAVAVTDAPATVLNNTAVAHHGVWAIALGLTIAIAGIIVNVYVPLRAIAPIAAVVAVTATVQLSVQHFYGPGLGGLAGAVVAAAAAAVAHRLPNGPSWQVAYLPAFWVLVPGSFGLLNTAGLGSGTDTHAILTAVFAVVGVSVGTLIGAPFGRLGLRNA
ncbi:MAG: threonine/serine exporter family protein [Actinomycetota bacterium]|nr:threonine/serine exporter family protein [Actinomycetota bacterium]